MRIGAPGKERPAALTYDDATPVLRDLSGIVDDITPQTLSPLELIRIRRELETRGSGLRALDPRQRIGAPVTGVGKIVCVGLNYREHAKEAKAEMPAEPILFMKAPDTIVGAHDDVLIPPTSVKTDYEVELAVVIGTLARYLTDSDDALSYIAGYAISDDVSEREYQLERGGQWDKGKNCETFNPLGPALITADEIADPQNLALSLSVNGESRQNSSTADMIFSVDFLVRYISQFMPLYPGDVINTGTPQGVGFGFNPPQYLNDGDEVVVAIAGLGEQRHTFRRRLGNARTIPNDHGRSAD